MKGYYSTNSALHKQLREQAARREWSGEHFAQLTEWRPIV